MKKSSLIYLLLLVGGTIGLLFLVMPAQAQDAGKERELQRVIEAQQKQLEAQQEQLDAQRRLLQELQSQTNSVVKDAVEACQIWVKFGPDKAMNEFN